MIFASIFQTGREANRKGKTRRGNASPGIQNQVMLSCKTGRDSRIHQEHNVLLKQLRGNHDGIFVNGSAVYLIIAKTEIN
jgi:hypothetical protein